MILIDTILAERECAENPIEVALVGAGYSGRNIAYQIVKSFPSIRLAAICNRTLDRAFQAYSGAGIEHPHFVETPNALEEAMWTKQFAVTDDPSVVCEAGGIDAVIESTGTIDFGAEVVLRAIRNGKHVILMNVELDSTLGPILKAHANRSDVVYTNSDGDEPGVAMNMIRFLKTIGMQPLVAGNLKGLYDPYRTPETQKEFAMKVHQDPKKITSFADGTKLSMELAVLANATGFRVAKRGMYGPALNDVNESSGFFSDKVIENGMVDFLVGAAPASGAFVLAHSEDPVRAAYLQYLKMGEGPLYVFYVPFHLPQLEIPLTVARAVLFKDATVAPIGPPSCDAVSVAKRDLKAGEILDGLGGFSCYALLDNYEASRAEEALPMGLSEGCKLTRNVMKDHLITYRDVKLPKGRLSDRLRKEQDESDFK